MTDYPYILARKKRLQAAERQRLRIMGGTLCIVLWLVSAFQFYLVPVQAAWLDVLWHTLMWSTVALFTFLMFKPASIRPLEKILQTIGKLLGVILLKCVLAILYIVLVTPLGLLLQKIYKHNLFLSWETQPELLTAWEEKQPTYDSRADKPVPAFFFPVYLIYVMVQNKAYILIPLIINLLLIAMLVFFVQTPVVAPFVYTVF